MKKEMACCFLPAVRHTYKLFHHIEFSNYMKWAPREVLQTCLLGRHRQTPS